MLGLACAQTCGNIDAKTRGINELEADASVGIIYMSAGTYRISNSLTLNKPIVGEAGAVFSVDKGVTLKIINQPEHPLSLFFTGEGQVQFLDGTVRVHPEWFGAKANGQADDSAAVQRAFNAAAVTGNAMLYLKGTYGLGAAVRFTNQATIMAEPTSKFISVGGNSRGVVFSSGVFAHKNILPNLEGFGDYCVKLYGSDMSALQLYDLKNCGDGIVIGATPSTPDQNHALDNTIWFNTIINPSKAAIAFRMDDGCFGPACIVQGNQIVGNNIIGGRVAIAFVQNNARASQAAAWDSNQIDVGMIDPPTSGPYSMLYAKPLSNRVILKIGAMKRPPPGGTLFSGQHNLGQFVINLAETLGESQLNLYGELSLIELTGKVTPLYPSILATTSSNSKYLFNGGKSLVGNFHILRAVAKSDWPAGETRAYYFYSQLATRWLYQIKCGGKKQRNGLFPLTCTQASDNSYDWPGVKEEVVVYLMNTSGKKILKGATVEFTVALSTLGTPPIA